MGDLILQIFTCFRGSSQIVVLVHDKLSGDGTLLDGISMISELWPH
jgi:hypothetical protein